jgi:RimJ/RimL family protein N-acetyltransferase
MRGVPRVQFTEPILTERLRLRPFTENDLDDLCDLQSRPELTRYLYWDPRQRHEVAVSLQKKVAATTITNDGDMLSVAVTKKSGGPIIGDLNLVFVSALHQHAEFGYIFHPDVHGQGYATEAARALVNFAFDHLELHRVTAELDARNTASAALLERLGLRREAHLVENEWVKGEWTDGLTYAVLATEWATTRQLHNQ